MSFKEYIQSHKQEIYRTICNYVPLSDPMTENSSRIMRDYIDRQGGYRRPGLLMLTGQLFGASSEELLLPAAAQQLSEDWILMQDDVEDGSELRRGKPAAQRIYGDARAFNASNIGQIAMWRILKDYILKYGPERGNKVWEKFNHMLTLTVEGQDLESRFNHSIRRLDKVDEEFYFRIVETKTCYYTVYGPMQIGALVADQHDRILGILEAIGRPAGIAFQIKDDLLDMTSDEKEFGKKRYGDLYEGKVTLIILHTFADATDAEKEKMNSIYRKDRSDKTEDDIRYLVEAIEKYDGIGYASRRGEKFKDEAVRILEEHENDFPTNSYHPIFRSAVEELYSRSK